MARVEIPQPHRTFRHAHVVATGEGDLTELDDQSRTV